MTGPPPASWAVDPETAGAREVLRGLWRLRLPLGWEHIDHVNAYVIEREDGVMLVDCGSGGDPSCKAALDRALAQTGHQLADVSALVLTHAHSDHCGLARTVLEASGAELWSHPGIGHLYDVLRDPAHSEIRRRRRAELEGVPASRLDAFADVREETTGVDGLVTPDHLLVDGASIGSTLGSWEVLETPGHAPSHVSLLQRERGLLIAGDLVCAVFVPWLDYGWTPDPYAESLGALDRLDALDNLTLTLPGHGRPLAELDGVLSEHRHGFTARLDAVCRALDGGPRGSYELTEQIYGTEDDTDAVGHLGEVLALLRHLRLGGQVTRALADGIHTYRRERETQERTA